MFCWRATFQKYMGPILTDTGTLLAPLATGPMPVRSGCFASTSHTPDASMHVSIGRARCMAFSHSEQVLYWSRGLVQLQSCSNHCVCAHAGVQTCRMAENSCPVGDKGERAGWLKRQHDEILGFVYSHLKKIIKSLTQS